MSEYDDKKYVSCKGCGCELEADQHKCPYCKTINPSAPKKKPSKLVFIIPVIILDVIAVIVWLISSNSSNNNAILNPDNIKINTVMNGLGTKPIGTRAELTVDKDSVKNLSDQDFDSFIETEIAGKEYNWFTIMFNDGTGIIFTGCDTTLPVYGKVDKEGMLEKPIGYIKRLQDNDEFSFEYDPI